MPNIYNQNIGGYLNFAEKVVTELNRLPPAVRKRIEAQSSDLFGLIKNRRAPRILMLGKEGAGKTTFLTALLNAELDEPNSKKPHWVSYKRKEMSLELLDISLSDLPRENPEPAVAAKPEPEDIFIKIFDISAPETQQVKQIERSSGLNPDIIEALEKECPDLILLMVKATEIGKRALDELQELEKIHQAV